MTNAIDRIALAILAASAVAALTLAVAYAAPAPQKPGTIDLTQTLIDLHGHPVVDGRQATSAGDCSKCEPITLITVIDRALTEPEYGDLPVPEQGRPTPPPSAAQTQQQVARARLADRLVATAKAASFSPKELALVIKRVEVAYPFGIIPYIVLKAIAPDDGDLQAQAE